MREVSGMRLKKMVMLAMFVAIGVVISPILRVEGCCPMQHVVNIVCSVFMGPWYSLLCAVLIGVIRMACMGIPPLALTGAVFGAFLSGEFYRIFGSRRGASSPRRAARCSARGSSARSSPIR